MHIRLRAALLFALICFADAGLAQNLLVNPELNSAEGGWSLSSGNASSFATWSPDVGYPTPGSASLTANFSGDSVWFQQCLNITPQNIDLVGWSKVRYTGGSGNFGTVSLSTFDVPNCAASNVQYASATLSGTVVDNWYEHRLMNYTLPDGTQSVMVFLNLAVSDFSVGVNIDHVGFGPAGTVIPSDIVFKNDFEE